MNSRKSIWCDEIYLGSGAGAAGAAGSGARERRDCSYKSNPLRASTQVIEIDDGDEMDQDRDQVQRDRDQEKRDREQEKRDREQEKRDAEAREARSGTGSDGPPGRPV